MVQLKQIKFADIGVLTIIASFGAPNTYRVRIKLKKIAEMTGVSLSMISESVSRLKKAGVMVGGIDNAGARYYVIDPSIISFNNNPRHIAAAYAEIERSLVEQQKAD